MNIIPNLAFCLLVLYWTIHYTLCTAHSTINCRVNFSLGGEAAVGSFSPSRVTAGHRTALLSAPLLYTALFHCSTLHCISLHCSTVQCSAVQCSAVQYSTVQYSVVQYSAVQCSKGQGRGEYYHALHNNPDRIQFGMSYCSAVLQSTLQCTAVCTGNCTL